MIEYKAVAMDLDDTLLTSDLQISEADFAAMSERWDACNFGIRKTNLCN